MTVLNTAVASLSYPSLVGPLTYGVDISATPSASGLTGTVAYTQSGGGLALSVPNETDTTTTVEMEKEFKV